MLQHAARALIDQLTKDYEVRLTDGVEPAPRVAEAWPDSTTVRLEPTAGCAPITFTFTPFPGVSLRYGFTGEAGFPSCGCDACTDDDPVSETRRMADLVGGVVAGNYTESRKHRRFGRDTFRATMVVEDGWEGTGGFVGRDEEHIPVGTTDWAPWPRRDR
ncbi:MAG: hypothetical protein KDB24_14890 [Microthrixaceae bacterium]|nr:hypothetical protein [Microthrixaceae bacterium]